MRLITIMIVGLMMAGVGGCGEGASLPDGIARVQAVTGQEKRVRGFIEAFNAHDPQAMASFCAPTLQWGYVSGTAHSVAGNGIDDLQEQMAAYFAQTPGVRSEIENIIANGDTIAITERVYWTPADEDTEKTQASIAVYQFKDEMISAVWYYPEQ